MRLFIICLIILLFGYCETEEVREETKKIEKILIKIAEKSWLKGNSNKYPNCPRENCQFTFDEAYSYCKGLNMRLPKKEELEKAIKENSKEIFDGLEKQWYWTSSNASKNNSDEYLVWILTSEILAKDLINKKVDTKNYGVASTQKYEFAKVYIPWPGFNPRVDYHKKNNISIMGLSAGVPSDFHNESIMFDGAVRCVED